MKVLIACEYSGIVRDAFIKRGHDAMSCDILPTESEGPHYQGDVLDLLNGWWDLMIAHPPCTRLCNSGVRWLNERNLWGEMREGAEFFRNLMGANISRIAIENPIPHGYAVKEIGKKYDQIVQPWQFGHGETKATCLWLKNLPKLTPTKIVRERVGRVFRLPPSEDRAKLRSKTYKGIAEAMADQWGGGNPCTQ